MGLSSRLDLSPRCTHLKGHGGLKATVEDVNTQLPNYRFVIKTDVKQYYESIDHRVLLNQLSEDISDAFLWRLLYQFVNRTVERGGNFIEYKKGIARGCALSPVIAAYYLLAMDNHFSNQPQYYYARYMDDIIILAKTRWQCRRAIKVVNTTLNEFKLEKAPDKTYIGRIEKGFDFLGYHFSREPLELANKTLNNFSSQWQRLYEQKKKASPKEDNALILAAYWRRWCGWARGGLSQDNQQSINLQIDALVASYRINQVARS